MPAPHRRLSHLVERAADRIWWTALPRTVPLHPLQVCVLHLPAIWRPDPILPLPTRTDFQTATDREELQGIIPEINNQPRKHFDQTTPAQTYQPTHTITTPRVQGGNATRGDVHVHWVKDCASMGIRDGHVPLRL